MGWNFRKSINLGFGFRINLSKSGIGYSWGFPGYRVTKMANGRNRITYSIPGTGISYVEHSNRNTSPNTYNDENKLLTGETELFKNIPIENIQKDDVILKKINTARTINKCANLFILLGCLSYFNLIYLIFLAIGILFKVYLNRTHKIGLYYEFDEKTRKMYNSLRESLIILSNSQKIWQVSSSTNVYNIKYNAGASKNISRTKAFITSKLPWYLKTNIEIFGLNLKREKIFFTPDRILVFKPFKKVFGCTYRDLHIDIVTTNFVESEKVQKDSKVVNYTWKYVNKDGSRDLRFSYNKRYPVCKYGEILFKSPNGINTVIEFSNSGFTEKIRSNLVIFANTFNEILSYSNSMKGDK